MKKIETYYVITEIEQTTANYDDRCDNPCRIEFLKESYETLEFKSKDSAKAEILKRGLKGSNDMNWTILECYRVVVK